MVPDQITREIMIDAPVEVVWSMVTEPDHLGSWFSDSAEVDLRPGGAAMFTWNEYGSYRARIVRVERPHLVAFRWVRRVGVEPGEGSSTLVEFRLAADGDGTRVRVIESGFRELGWSEEERAEYADENARGWRIELSELREYASRRYSRSTPS